MKTATFSMVWKVMGKQTIELPEDIDTTDESAVRSFIENNWDDISLPAESDYLTGSDEFDELISIEEDGSLSDVVKILYDIRPDIPVSIQGPDVRADWCDLGEGLCGDYDPDDPDDIPLLRFDVYFWDDMWVPIDDASYCTLMPATADRKVLTDNLRLIYDEYEKYSLGETELSARQLGEKLSFIGAGC